MYVAIFPPHLDYYQLETSAGVCVLLHAIRHGWCPSCARDVSRAAVLQRCTRHTA